MDTRIVEIYLDMDGVLCNFVEAFLARAVHRNPYDDPENLGRWDIFNLIGLSWDEAWELCGDQQFWEALLWHDEGAIIVQKAEEAVGQENVYILSSQAKSSGAAAGKMEWIDTWLPEYLDRVILTRCKEKIAAPNRLLIDDYDKNVILFEQAGGQCVQVPRPWNQLHHHETLSYFEEQFDRTVATMRDRERRPGAYK